jgi:hypothetical protein
MERKLTDEQIMRAFLDEAEKIGKLHARLASVFQIMGLMAADLGMPQYAAMLHELMSDMDDEYPDKDG